jgi:FtsH-binding integral membrane protein
VALEDTTNPAGVPGTLERAGAVDAARARAQARAVFGQVMFLVAVTAGFTAAGAWIGRDLSGGWVIACFVAALLAILGLGFVRGVGAPAMGLLFGAGLLLGLALGPGLATYASVDNGAGIMARAAGATALFIGGLGAYGYATSRDLSSWRRPLLYALLGLLGFGIVAILLGLPGGATIYAALGLGVFGAFTIYDFNRLRRARPDDVVWIACSIYLDILNVFLFMLQLLGGGGRD